MGGPGSETRPSMANMFAALDKSKKKKADKEAKEAKKAKVWDFPHFLQSAMNIRNL